MGEKLTYSHRIAAGWRVEYKLTKKGGELAIIVGGGIFEFRLTKTKDLDTLHKALHTAEKAAVALDGVGVETLGWSGEQPKSAPDATENEDMLSEGAMQLLCALCKGDDIDDQHVLFGQLHQRGLLCHIGVGRYAISTAGVIVLAEQEG